MSVDELRRGLRRSSLGGAGAVQHRRRRLRQAPARQAGDDLGELRRLDPRARVGRAAGPREPGGAHARRTRRQAGRPRRGRPAADARDRGDLLRRLEARRDPALDVGALRRRCDRAPALGLGREAARHRRRQRAALRPTVGAGHARARARHAGSGPDGFRLRRHRGRRPGAALLHVRHDRAREGDRPRAPLHPRPRGVPLLPRGAGRRALPRDGRVGLGRGDRAAARPVAARRACSASTGARAASTRTSSSTS